MMGVLLASFCFGLFSCAGAGKKDFDAANFSAQDKNDRQEYVREYADLLGTAGLNAEKKADTVQKYFCNCFNKLGHACMKNSEGVSQDDRRIWAKGSSAYFTLKALGFKQHADSDLCPKLL